LASLSSNKEAPIFRLYHLPDLSLMASFGMRGHGPVTDGKKIYILSKSDERNPCSCLEVWTWEGEPVARYQLDRELDHFVIEGNVLYGVDNGNIYEDEVIKILEYNLLALY